VGHPGPEEAFYRLNKEKQKLEARGVYPAPKVLAGILEVREEEVDSMQRRLAFSDISLNRPCTKEATTRSWIR